jgi:hypothetical protein
MKIGFKIGNLSVPLNMSYDEIFYANEAFSFSKNLSLRNNTFGYPGEQDLGFTFVSGDSIPIFLASIISRLKDNPFFGLNVYYLLSVGLIGLSFFISAKILGASIFLSFVFSIFVSLSHHNLAWTTQAPTFGSSFLIPIFFSVLILKLREKSSRPTFLRSRTGWISWSIFLIFFGAFFSYFTLYTLLLIGTLIVFSLLSRGDLLVLKILIRDISLIVIGFLLLAIPSLIKVFDTVGSINYFKERHPTAAFINSGTPFQTVYPLEDSYTWKIVDFFNIPWEESWGSLKGVLQSRDIFHGGWSESIDIFLIILLLTILFIRGKNRANKIETPISITENLRYLSVLSISALLWMWGGGLGTILAVTFFPTLRQYSAFGIFLLIFVALFLSVSLTEVTSTKVKAPNLFRYISFTLLLTVSLLNTLTQVPPAVAGQNYERLQEIIGFTNKLPRDCNVLQFPVVHYPWEPPGNPGYRMLLPGLLSKRSDLKWSYGAVGGTKAWLAQAKFREQQNNPTNSLIQEAKSSNFCAILVDREAWNAFYNFKPYANYESTPRISYDEFLARIPGVKLQNFSDGSQFALKIIK